MIKNIFKEVILFIVILIISIEFSFGLAILLVTTVPRIIHDTEYSKNYSEEKFNQIQIGMPKENVLQLLGEPLSIRDMKLFWEKKDCCGVSDTLFFYSKDKSGGSYYQRIIAVKHGKVVEITKEFYYD